jgi:O-antigen ligase
MATFLRAKALDLQTFAQAAHWLAVGVGVSLPWSTSATSILIVLWLLALVPTLDVAALRRELASAAGGLPVLLWLIAAIGMAWADVTWSERFGGLTGYHKLLFIPLLLAQFRRSEHGVIAFYGFLVSASCLLAASWITEFVPALTPGGKAPGIPAKDYVSQSGIFLICAFGLIGAACAYWRERKWHIVVALAALALFFLADIAFVITSRTALLVAPLLVVALGYRQFGIKGVVAAVVIAAALAAALWLESPALRARVSYSVGELRAYIDKNEASSGGMHLEFLKKSVSIIATAPVVGHGTGSIPEQFRLTIAGQTGAAAIFTDNPHNQIFAVGIELGLVGAAALVAMWIAHFMLFRGGGLAGWIGMIIVLENMASCLVNSHLSDFTHGWLYVFGVGIAGGTVLREKNLRAAASSKAPP